jgi:hypothetical protein
VERVSERRDEVGKFADKLFYIISIDRPVVFMIEKQRIALLIFYINIWYLGARGRVDG